MELRRGCAVAARRSQSFRQRQPWFGAIRRLLYSISRQLDRRFKLALGDLRLQKARYAPAVVGLEQRAKSFLGLFVPMFPVIQFGELLAAFIRSWDASEAPWQVLRALFPVRPC